MITRQSHHSLETNRPKRGDISDDLISPFLESGTTIPLCDGLSRNPWLHHDMARLQYKRLDGHLQEVALDYDDNAPCVPDNG